MLPIIPIHLKSGISAVIAFSVCFTAINAGTVVSQSSFKNSNIGGPPMDIFYPSDDFEVLRQLSAFFCWAFAARLGWRYADWLVRKLGELRRVFFRKKEEP